MSNSNSLFWRRSLILSLFVWAFACSDGGCDGGCGGGGGCGGCGGGTGGGAPYVFQGTLEDNVVFQGAQVHVTETGLGFIEQNLPGIAAAALGGESLSFCLPPTDIDLTITTLNLCGSETCAETDEFGNPTPGCQLEVDLGNVFMNPIRTPDERADELRVSLNLILNESISGDPCNIALSSEGEGLPVTATVTFRVDGPPGEETHIEFTADNLELDLGQLNIDITSAGGFGGGIACGLGDLIVPLLSGLLADQITGPLNDAIGPLLCTQCTTSADCEAGVSSCSGDGVCTFDGTDTCVPIALGVETEVDLGGLLSSVAPGLDAKLGVLAYAANYADMMGPRDDASLPYRGMDLALELGFHSDPNLCVPYVDPPDNARYAKSPAINTETTPAGGAFQLGIGAAKPALEMALWAVYNSGALCLSIGSDTVEQVSTSTFGLLLPSLSQITGPGNKPMEIQLRPQERPLIDLGAGTVEYDADGTPSIVEPLLTLRLNNLDLDFYAFIEERMVRIMTLNTDIAVPLGLDVNENNELIIVLGDLSQAIERIEPVNGELLAASELASVATLLPTLLSSLLPSLTGGLLEPIAIPEFQGISIQIPQGGITSVDDNNMLAIYANLALVASKKSLALMPRVTSLKVDGPSAGELEATRRAATSQGVGVDLSAVTPTVSIGVETSGTDEELEYSYRINGGLWSLWYRSEVLRIRNAALALAGEYHVDIRARVRNQPETTSGNLASTSFVIDYQAPLIQVARDGLVATYNVADSASDLANLVVNYRINGGEWIIGDLSGALDLTAFGGQNVVVEVEAVDSNGNRALEKAEFNLGQYTSSGVHIAAPTESQTGCNAAKGTSGSVWALALAMVASFWRRRKTLAAGLGVVAIGTLAAGCNKDKANGEKVGCDPDCAEGLVCEAGVCVDPADECTVNEDCAEGQICVEGACVPGCAVDEDCPEGETCIDGACVGGCSSNAECPDGQICEDGGCVDAGCTSDAECAEACDAPNVATCNDGVCECDVPCAEGCAEGTACCYESNSCVDVSAVCAPADCEPGTRAQAVGDPTFDSDTCEAAVDCECVELPPLDPGFLGQYAELAVAAGGAQRAVAAYNSRYGDLMVGIIGEDDAVTWQYVDGTPADGAVTGSLNGPRGGIAAAGPDVGLRPSIEIDSTGGFHVSYQAVTGDEPTALRYAHGESTTEGFNWTTMTLDPDANSGVYSDVVLAPDGLPVVFYMVANRPTGDSVPAVFTSSIRMRKATIASPTSAADFGPAVTVAESISTLPCGSTCAGRNLCRLDLNVCQEKSDAADCGGACTDGECFSNADGSSVCSAAAEKPALVTLTEGIGVFLDAELLPTGEFGLAFYDRTHGNLGYAVVPADAAAPVAWSVVDGEAFDAETSSNVDTGDAGWMPDLYVRGDGTVLISYVNATSRELRLADLTASTNQPIDDGLRCFAFEGDNCTQPVLSRIGFDSAIADGDNLSIVYQDATHHEVRESVLGIFGWEPAITVAGDEEPYDGAFGFYLAQGIGANGRFAISYRFMQRATPAVRDLRVLPR